MTGSLWGKGKGGKHDVDVESRMWEHSYTRACGARALPTSLSALPTCSDIQVPSSGVARIWSFMLDVVPCVAKNSPHSAILILPMSGNTQVMI